MFKKICIYILTALFIIPLNIITFFDINFGDITINSALNREYGIIRSGMFDTGYLVVYDIQVPNYSSKNPQIQENINTCVEFVKSRLKDLGYYNAKVYHSDDLEIIAELPSVAKVSSVAKIVQSSGQIEFTDWQGNVLMTGEYIESAYLENDIIKIKLTESGIEKFTDISKSVAENAAVGANFILININGEQISKVYVPSKYSLNGIISDTITISGNFSTGEASKIVDFINDGRLPYSLKFNNIIDIEDSQAINMLPEYIAVLLAALIIALSVLSIIFKQSPIPFILTADSLFCVMLICISNLQIPTNGIVFLAIVLSVVCFLIFVALLLSNNVLAVCSNGIKYKSNFPYILVADMSVVVLLMSLTGMLLTNGSIYDFLGTIAVCTLLNIVSIILILPIFIKYFNFPDLSKRGLSK